MVILLFVFLREKYISVLVCTILVHSTFFLISECVHLYWRSCRDKNHISEISLQLGPWMRFRYHKFSAFTKDLKLALCWVVQKTRVKASFACVDSGRGGVAGEAAARAESSCFAGRFLILQLPLCYGLNVCVPTLLKFICWNPNPPKWWY